MNFGTVCKKFNEARSATLKSALAAHVAIVEGRKSFKERSESDPNAKVEVTEAASSSFSKTIHFGVTNNEVYGHLEKNPYQVIELFHAQLVQRWQDFLADIYLDMVLDVIKGQKKWSLLPIKNIEIPFAILKNEVEIGNFANSCCQSFSFQSVKEKQRIIFNALNFNSNLKAQLKRIEVKKKIIEENILIRNILQHHHGKVTSKDLADLGVKSFKVVISDNEQIEIKATEIVFRTYKDLEKFSEAIFEVTRIIKEVGVIANLQL